MSKWSTMLQWFNKLFHRENGQEVNQMDSVTQDRQRRSEELRSRVATTLRRLGIVKVDNEQDQQRIDALCQHVFSRASRLSYRQHSPDDIQQLYGSINWKDDLPAVRRAMVRHCVSDPSLASIDPLCKTADWPESWQTRFDADQEIYELLESLHRELRKYEPRVIDTRPMSERLRSECFKEVARLSGRTEKGVARVYDGLNWRDLPKERNAEIQRYLSPELPEVTTFDPRRSAGNQREYEQYQRELRAYEIAKPFAAEATRQIVRLFINLHSDLNNLRTAELARAAERKRLDQRIAQLQRVRDGVQAQV